MESQYILNEIRKVFHIQKAIMREKDMKKLVGLIYDINRKDLPKAISKIVHDLIFLGEGRSKNLDFLDDFIVSILVHENADIGMRWHVEMSEKQSNVMAKGIEELSRWDALRVWKDSLKNTAHLIKGTSNA